MKMNKKRMSNRRFMAILIPIMAIVLVTLMICNLLALNYRGLISTFFNHSTYKIVETSGSTRFSSSSTWERASTALSMALPKRE